MNWYCCAVFLKKKLGCQNLRPAYHSQLIFTTCISNYNRNHLNHKRQSNNRYKTIYGNKPKKTSFFYFTLSWMIRETWLYKNKGYLCWKIIETFVSKKTNKNKRNKIKLKRGKNINCFSPKQYLKMIKLISLQIKHEFLILNNVLYFLKKIKSNNGK